MPPQTARLHKMAQQKVQRDLHSLGITYKKSIKLSIIATYLANPEEYHRLQQDQGDYWLYVGNGFDHKSTVLRWRSGSPVKIPTHYALCLAYRYLSGATVTVEQLTAGPLEPIIHYRDTHDEIKQILDNFHHLEQYPHHIRLFAG